jgi:hypothetical protein
MVRRTDLLSSRVRTYDSTPRNRRLRSRATRAISEKPRIRRDKAVARQTGETPQKWLGAVPARNAYPPLVHNLFSITLKSSPRLSARALRVSARFRATLRSTLRIWRLPARRAHCVLWITVVCQTTIQCSSIRRSRCRYPQSQPAASVATADPGAGRYTRNNDNRTTRRDARSPRKVVP